mgnify:CR=1 FL=1
MIKIISGVYGYLDKNGCVKPKTEKDGPFSLTKEQEARLVVLGVAEYVTSPTNVTAQDILPVEGTGHLDPEQLGELTNAQLKEMAEAMGIDTKKLTTKAKLIEAITEANVIQGPAEDGEEETDGDAGDDGEQAPTFDATEAVQ